ncbi:MAG TPA: glycosyltransferase, partial [Thermodesulfobacteriota bacterium]|nr:glycosyltransferase [Thermodesulfobacteriota bacterium]
RRPYTLILSGIPTIRVFEALACGIPLVCSPWDDSEGLFTPGRDFWVAGSGKEMEASLKMLLENRDLREDLGSHGLATVLSRHTCSHRVDQLLRIFHEFGERPAGLRSGMAQARRVGAAPGGVPPGGAS